jgi:hypothetical protein
VGSVVDHFTVNVIDASGEQSSSCEVHFLFPFLSFLTSYIDIIQTRLEAVNKKKKIFLRFFLDVFGMVFARGGGIGIPPYTEHLYKRAYPPYGGWGGASIPLMGGGFIILLYSLAWD